MSGVYFNGVYKRRDDPDQAINEKFWNVLTIVANVDLCQAYVNTTFYVVLNVCRKSGKWALMYMFVNGIDFAFAIGFFNCSDFFGF
jgi:hypothetical protein